MQTETDFNIRMAAFDWLSDMTTRYGDVLPRSLLQQGFEYHGQRIPLVSPQGIFKPRMMTLPLSIATTPKGPYHDVFGQDGLLEYRYRGTESNQTDNVGLRKACYRQTPLIYFHGLVPGKYLALWPVYIVGDDPRTLTFRVAVDDTKTIKQERTDISSIDDETTIRREYITSTVRVRLDQRSFREKVLSAYRSQCSLCRLKHSELLDAAHIIPDSEPSGEPRIANGIALCKLHHAAFDSMFIGIAPDFSVHIRKDILDEIDGPMLRYGLQQMQGRKLILPASKANWPDRDALEWRFNRFFSAE